MVINLPSIISLISRLICGENIVRKGVSTTPSFKIIPHYWGPPPPPPPKPPPLPGPPPPPPPPPPPFLKIPHPLTLPTNRSFQVFLNNRNATVKLSSINTVLGIIKCMLSNVYIISLYCRDGFSHPFIFFVLSKGILHVKLRNN